MGVRRLLCLLAALAFTGGIAAADGETPAPDPEPVPLYTNEDLEKYGPSAAPDRPVADAVAGGDQDWAFVNEFIEGQYEKIKAEREYSLEMAERDARLSEPEWDGWDGRLLLAPRARWWWHDWYAPPVYPTPYDKHGIKTPSARAGRPLESGHYVSRRGGRGRGSGGEGGHRGSGGGGGSRR
jgi:hypothetical protein